MTRRFVLLQAKLQRGAEQADRREFVNPDKVSEKIKAMKKTRAKMRAQGR